MRIAMLVFAAALGTTAAHAQDATDASAQAQASMLAAQQQQQQMQATFDQLQLSNELAAQQLMDAMNLQMSLGFQQAALEGATEARNRAARAPTPVFSPRAGTYTGWVLVSILSGLPGAATYYTIDGTMPTVTSARYSAPILLTATTKLRALIVAPNIVQSDVAAATYTVAPEPAR